MAKRRGHGDGSIDQRGENSWRLRYRLNGARYSKTVRGTKSEAQKALREALHAGDTGGHVAPDKITVAEWVDRWLALIEREPEANGPRRRGLVNTRTAERYSQLLKLHVVPTLGTRPLQQLQPTEIDNLYLRLERDLSLRTVHHVHTVFGGCLRAAVRKGVLMSNPVDRAEAPVAGDSDRGIVLDEESLLRLVRGFRGTVLFPIVATAAFTGMRRNEILGLRWVDLDPAARTITVRRSLEETERFGLAFKEPKTARGKRTIEIDEDLMAVLLVERERHLRLAAGVPDGAAVDLSLVRLPDGALMFPNPSADGDLTRPRHPRAVTKEFMRKASALGFRRVRLHDLRGSHETLLLDKGIPVHVVAARCGHDPAVLLRSYAKRTKKADSTAAAAIAALSRSALRP